MTDERLPISIAFKTNFNKRNGFVLEEKVEVRWHPRSRNLSLLNSTQDGILPAAKSNYHSEFEETI